MRTQDGGLRITLDAERTARRVLLTWLAIDLLMVSLDFVINRRDLLGHPVAQRLFNLVVEGTVGAWFGVTQTLLVGIVLWLIYVGVRRDEEVSRWRARGWCLLCVYFVYMALDDGSFLHESVGQILSDWLAPETRSTIAPSGLGRLVAAFPSYAWELFFVPVLGAAGVFMVIFGWRELRRRSLRLCVAATFLCMAAAVGLDFLEGTETAFPRLARALSVEAEPLTHYLKVLEEFLENFGTTLALYAFVAHLLWVYRDLHLRGQAPSPRNRGMGSP